MYNLIDVLLEEKSSLQPRGKFLLTLVVLIVQDTMHELTFEPKYYLSCTEYISWMIPGLGQLLIAVLIYYKQNGRLKIIQFHNNLSVAKLNKYAILNLAFYKIRLTFSHWKYELTTFQAMGSWHKLLIGIKLFYHGKVSSIGPTYDSRGNLWVYSLPDYYPIRHLNSLIHLKNETIYLTW